MGVFFLVSDGHARRGAGARSPLHQRRSLSRARRIQDAEHALASRRHRAGDGERPDWTPPFKPVLKAMGVDASMIMDFHGDGHPADLTDLRLDELRRLLPRAPGAVRSGVSADSRGGSERASGRPLGASCFRSRCTGS